MSLEQEFFYKTRKIIKLFCRKKTPAKEGAASADFTSSISLTVSFGLSLD